MDEFNVFLSKAMRFCSSKEVCFKDITLKLNYWDANPDHIEKILNILVEEKFINEERYAKAFASDKFKFNNWGRKKISFQLTGKNISTLNIQKALNEISEEEYYKTAQKLILNKLKSIKSDNILEIKNKILLFMTNKGYETDIVFNLLNKLVI